MAFAVCTTMLSSMCLGTVSISLSLAVCFCTFSMGFGYWRSSLVAFNSSCFSSSYFSTLLSMRFRCLLSYVAFSSCCWCMAF